MPAEGRTLAQRVSKLEAELAAIHAEQVEAERLNNSIARLGVGASDLGEALKTVDKNQQVLTRLGKELAEVKKKTVTKEQLEEQARVDEEAAAAKRRTRVRRVAAAGAALLLLLLIGAGAVFRYERDQREQAIDRQRADVARRAATVDACEKRNEQSQIMADLFTAFLRQVPPERDAEPTVVALRKSLVRFKSLITDCSTLK